MHESTTTEGNLGHPLGGNALHTSRIAVFVCGVLTGASFGILFAPAPGIDIRRRLNSAVRNGYNRASRPLRGARPSKPGVAAFVDRTRVAFPHDVPAEGTGDTPTQAESTGRSER
jgi:hypothetical protein